MPVSIGKLSFQTIFIYFWKLFFKPNPSHKIITSAKQFITFGLGIFCARLLSIISQVLMGRSLGPELYGQLTIILVLATYFSMPMVNGWALVFTKIASRTEDNELQLQALKSLFLVVGICTLLTIALLLLLKSPLATLLYINDKMMCLTIIMSVCYGWWILAKTICQGYQDWNSYITIENFWAILILTGIIALVLSSHATLVALSSVFYAGYVLSAFIISRRTLPILKARINLAFIKDILSHGWFLLLNGLVGVATFSIDRIIINRSLGPAEVGIYQAHFLATYGIMGAFITIVITYIFPLFCQKNKHDMHRTLSKVCLRQYPITLLLSASIGALVLWAYSYPVSIWLFFSLCVFNAIQFHAQLRIWHIASQGTRGSKITLISQIIFLLFNVVVLLFSINKIGINAGGISLVLGTLFSLIFINHYIKHNETTIR